MNSVALFRAGVRLAQWLPAPLVYGAARALGMVLGRLPLPAQARLAANLAVVLRTHPSDARVRRCVRQATEMHALNYVDLFRSWVTSDAYISRRFAPAGAGWDAFRAAQASGKGLVLVSAHFGRFEQLTAYMAHFGFGITLCVERLEPPALFDAFCALRRRPSIQLIPHDAALRPALRALGRGDVVAFFADWDPSGSSVEVQFFGRRTFFPGGPAFIARRAGVPLFVGMEVADPAGRTHQAMIEPPIEVPRTPDIEQDVQRTTQAIAGVFERYIAAHPEQWVMFHRIWS